MRKITFQVYLCLVLICCLTTVSAQRVMMRVEGSKSGFIKDLNVPNPKFADRMELSGYSFESSTPTAGNGIVAGRRTKSPLTITKNTGQSSVLLLTCHLTNENLKTVILDVYKINQNGQEVLDQTITLSNASVIYFKQSLDSANGSKNPRDEIRFSYQKIAVAAAVSGVTAEDSGNAN